MISLHGRGTVRLTVGPRWADIDLAGAGPRCPVVTSGGARTRGQGLVDALRRARALLALEA